MNLSSYRNFCKAEETKPQLTLSKAFIQLISPVDYVTNSRKCSFLIAADWFHLLLYLVFFAVDF